MGWNILLAFCGLFVLWGLGGIITQDLLWPIVLWRKKHPPIPLRMTVRDHHGIMAEPEPETKEPRHRCREIRDGKDCNGAIWVCECGRGYVSRGGNSIWSRHDGERLWDERKYWWRVRWWIPYHWRNVAYVRRVRKMKQQIVPREVA